MNDFANFVKVQGMDKENILIYDIERMNNIKNYLLTNDPSIINIYQEIDDYSPNGYQGLNFFFAPTDVLKDRFIRLFRSTVWIKTLMQYEFNLLTTNSTKEYYRRRAFLVEYLIRLKNNYIWFQHDDTRIIRDKTDYLYICLFFDQIRTFIIKEFNQLVPLVKDELKMELTRWFEANFDDVSTIRSFEDIDVLCNINLEQYDYIKENSSIVQKSNTDVYTFKLYFIDETSMQSTYNSLEDIDDINDLDDLENDFTANPLNDHILDNHKWIDFQ